MTIHEALASVMADVSHVGKRDFNTHAKFNFRGIDAVVNAVGPALRTHKVIVRPVVRSVAYDTVQTSTGKPSTACRVLVDYTFTAADGSELTATVAGEAWDSGDKACPKAMSVAFRTALIQTLALPTDEPDPDLHVYERAEPVAIPDEMGEARNELWRAAQRHGTTDAERWAVVDQVLDEQGVQRGTATAADLRAAITALDTGQAPAGSN